MDEQRGSQKQIAKRYEDRVDYRHARTPYRRTRLLVSLLVIAAGATGIYFGRTKAPPDFFSTGPLSNPHAHLKDGCVSCHQAEALPNESRFVQVLDSRFRNGAPSFERIDRACAQCHQLHDFHEPNVIANRSCSACHKEHLGSGPMHPVVSLDCASCHNDRAIMQASAARGTQLPAAQFHLNPKLINPRAVTLRLPRPAEGYTMTFASFNDGHPPFQLQRDSVRDPNVLRFNHQRHLNGADIPRTKCGAKLDCNYCHKPESDGRYMQRISFAAHCQECHSLQFDVRNPDFHLPHGDAQLVRTFLRTLPAQYAELARQKRGLTSDTQVRDFATQQVRQLLMQFPNAEQLERTVFFTSDPYKASQQTDTANRANYTGCAFCHDVKQTTAAPYAMAEITRPAPIDRWLPHAHFSHAKHEAVASCRDCHVGAQASRLTSDVLIPVKETCVRCHQPAGQAQKASECMTCHIYHAPEPPITTAAAAQRSFKQMLSRR